jgi:hypothetical protein
MRIFVLGAGAAGGYLARLLQRQGHIVWCGDREPARAERFLGGKRPIPVAAVNARNLWAIVRAARGAHLVVNAAPAVYNQIVLRAALRLRAHYLDLAAHLGRYPFKAEQLRFDRRFKAKRRVALINAGVAPGVTNLLVARSAELCERIESVRIRLYENTDSDDPVSTWSAETAFDEATSRPRVVRAGHFAFGRRFGEPEWFRFPPPVGRVRVVLAAQDEAGTLPHFIRLRELDVKIGGNEMDRLRRWYRLGKLRRRAHRFPRTLTPRQVARLLRRGVLQNARFAAAVVVRGMNKAELVEIRWFVNVPSLYQLRTRGLLATPVAFATAHAAAAFVRHFPRELHGVHPPEDLPAAVRRAVLRELKQRGFEMRLQVARVKKTDEEEDV